MFVQYRSQIKFLGHIVDSRGVSSDPEKTNAIKAMKIPSGVKELQRFLGMVNQLGKFSPNLAQISQPL